MIAACAALGAKAPNGGGEASLSGVTRPTSTCGKSGACIADFCPGGYCIGSRRIRARAGSLHLAFDQFHLELGDRLGGIEALRAGLRAVHDGVAAIEPERILEIVEPLAGRLVARIGDPAGRLQQCGGAEEALAVPPIARARGRAAGAQDALVETVELLAV